MSSKRSHTKSRLGCKQCKARHIKCDQTPPCCGNCAKKGIECEYQESNPALDNIRVLTPTTYPQKRSESAPVTASERSASPMPSPCFTLGDMSLFRHFILYTSLTMDPLHNEHYLHIWQHEVPLLAQTHLFLLHAILGFAAAHRATCEDNGQVELLLSARRHYDKALTLFRESVNVVTADRADALLSFCIIISFLTLRLEFEKASDERDPVGEFVSLLSIFHNSIGMLLEVGPFLQCSVVGGLLDHVWNKKGHAIAPDAELSLDRLGMLVASNYDANPADTLILDRALMKLRRFYTFASPRQGSWSFLMSWPVQVGPDICGLLQQHDPVALCILAHWCVPLYHAPVKWYFGDWPRRLMLVISQELHGSDWFGCLSWPLLQTIGDASCGGDVAFAY